MLAPSAAAQSFPKIVQTSKAVPVETVPKADSTASTRGRRGDTEMHWMAFNGDEAAVRRLIAAGARVNRRVDNGSTPLHLAAYNGHTGVVNLLIEHGAEVNARTAAGVTPLDWALRNGHREAAQQLVTHGARPGKNPSTTAAVSALPDSGAQLASAPAEGAVPEQASGPGAYRIQLASLSSRQSAVDAWAGYRDRFPDILAAFELTIQAFSLKGRQYYRVQAGRLTLEGARATCKQLARHSQPCMVVKSQ